jgi:hypothetical protein
MEEEILRINKAENCYAVGTKLDGMIIGNTEELVQLIKTSMSEKQLTHGEKKQAVNSKVIRNFQEHMVKLCRRD